MKRILGIVLVVVAVISMTSPVAAPASAAGGTPVVTLRVHVDGSGEFKATGAWRNVDGAYRESMRYSYWTGYGYTTQSLQQTYDQARRGRVVSYFAGTPSTTMQTWKITFTVHNSTDGVLGSDEIIASFPVTP